MGIRDELPSVIHSPIRLGILATLDKYRNATFALITDVLDISPSDLSKNLKILEDEGFISIAKRKTGRTYETTASMTLTGYQRFSTYKRALSELFDPNDDASDGPGASPTDPA